MFFFFFFSLYQHLGGHGHFSHTLLGVCDHGEAISTSVDVTNSIGFYDFFFSLMKLSIKNVGKKM